MTPARPPVSIPGGCNVPNVISDNYTHLGTKRGSIGRPLPGVNIKIVNRDTGKLVNVDEPGLLLVSGPNVMKGYLGESGKTADLIVGGWYDTGQTASFDKDWFIHVVG